MLSVQPVLGNVFLSVLHSFLTTLLTKPLISAHECPDIILPSYLFAIPGSLPGSYIYQLHFFQQAKLLDCSQGCEMFSISLFIYYIIGFMYLEVISNVNFH